MLGVPDFHPSAFPVTPYCDMKETAVPESSTTTMLVAVARVSHIGAGKAVHHPLLWLFCQWFFCLSLSHCLRMYKFHRLAHRDKVNGRPRYPFPVVNGVPFGFEGLPLLVRGLQISITRCVCCVKCVVFCHNYWFLLCSGGGDASLLHPLSVPLHT